GRVGVMIGDVSSHGFAAALVMAHVLSAAGIHAAASASPDVALRNLLDSVGDELRETDMYFTVFYGVLDRRARSLCWASAGHPHAFRLPRDGEPERLGATCPPLGLVGTEGLVSREVPWHVEDDLLCLWTDGLVDARNPAGEFYGERRLLDLLQRHRDEPPEEIVRTVMADADAWSQRPVDDRTLLVLRL
ncbi:MAG TPA: PP2C family protein-serine/threonine phosphatase, partial [Gemmatimonadales bacterium]|nr:PP2C family protein-serine/threonine phosphatase [Gemmatimonadales bacterium]